MCMCVCVCMYIHVCRHTNTYKYENIFYHIECIYSMCDVLLCKNKIGFNKLILVSFSGYIYIWMNNIYDMWVSAFTIHHYIIMYLSGVVKFYYVIKFQYKYLKINLISKWVK